MGEVEAGFWAPMSENPRAALQRRMDTLVDSYRWFARLEAGAVGGAVAGVPQSKNADAGPSRARVRASPAADKRRVAGVKRRGDAKENGRDLVSYGGSSDGDA